MRDCLIQFLTVVALWVAILEMLLKDRFPRIRVILIFLLVALGMVHLTLAYTLYREAMVA